MLAGFKVFESVNDHVHEWMLLFVKKAGGDRHAYYGWCHARVEHSSKANHSLAARVNPTRSFARCHGGSDVHVETGTGIVEVRLWSDGQCLQHLSGYCS